MKVALKSLCLFERNFDGRRLGAKLSGYVFITNFSMANLHPDRLIPT